MSFDWQRFCDSHGIEYITTGPATSRDNIYAKCPWCGDSDRGHHLGLSLAGKGWGCWRNQSHRGRAPEKLIQALLGVGWQEATRLAGKAVRGLPNGSESFSDAVRRAMGGQTKEPARKPPRIPKQFRLLFPKGEPIIDYMLMRKFDIREIGWLAERFDLYYAITGDWSYRLIIPVHNPDGTWATWTARAVHTDAKIRYKTLTSDPEKAGDGTLAMGPINDYLLGLPTLLTGGTTLILTEGPFDAMRLGLYAGLAGDIKVTCLFGKAISAAQIDWLVQLRPYYDRVVLLLDPDAAMDALGLQARLAPLNIQTQRLQGSCDPGDMDARQVESLFARILQKGK